MDFPRRPELPRNGVLGSEWDGFLQPRTASPADLIQGVRTAREQPSLASPPPGATASGGSPAGARPYIVGPYRVERAPGTGPAERPGNGAGEGVGEGDGERAGEGDGQQATASEGGGPDTAAEDAGSGELRGKPGVGEVDGER